MGNNSNHRPLFFSSIELDLMQNYTKLATKGIKVYKEFASKLVALMKMKHAPKLAAFKKKINK